MNSAISTCLYMSFWYMCLYIYVRNIFKSEFCLFHRTIYIYIYDTAIYLSNVFVPIYTLPSNVREFQFQYLVLSTFYFILATQCGMWDLRSSTRDQTCASPMEVPSPNHWTTNLNSWVWQKWTQHCKARILQLKINLKNWNQYYLIIFILKTFYFLLTYSGFTILCYFQVYSTVIQLYINIYSFFFGFFSLTDYHKILSTVPCAYSRSLLFILSACLNFSYSGSVFCCPFTRDNQAASNVFICSELKVSQIKVRACPQAALNPVGDSLTSKQIIAT